MKYIPRRFEGRHFLSGSVTQGKASKKLFVTSSSDPAATDDTGLGYAVGTTWVNTTSGQVFICSDASAEDAVWYGQEGDIINEPFTIAGSNGYIIGGYGNTGLVDTQEKVSFTSPANATDFGEAGRTVRNQGFGVQCDSSKSYGFTFGGLRDPWPTNTADIERHGFSAPTSGTNTGELTSNRESMATSTDGTKSMLMGGLSVSDGTQALDTIEMVTLSTSGESTSADSGAELSALVGYASGASDTVNGRGYRTGGNHFGASPPYPQTSSDVIEYSAFTSTADAADWGNLVTARQGHHACHANTTGVWASGHGGGPVNTQIETFSFSSPGNATDVGEMSTTFGGHAGHSSTDYGFATGGATPPSGYHDQIDRFSLVSSGDGADFGEISASRGYYAYTQG